MISKDALYLIAEINGMDSDKRKRRLSKADWDFVKSIEFQAKCGKELSDRQAWKLQEIYRTSQGHYSKLYSRII